jgi:hypothetical protein
MDFNLSSLPPENAHFKRRRQAARAAQGPGGVRPPHVTLNQIVADMMQVYAHHSSVHVELSCVRPDTWTRICAEHTNSAVPASQEKILPVLPSTMLPRRGEMMEDVLALSAFLGAALVGLAGNARIGGYLDDRRWLRVATFAAAFFLIAAIVTGRL